MAMPIPAMPGPSNRRYHLLAMLRAVGLTERELAQMLEDAAEEAERNIPKTWERLGIGAQITAAQRAQVLREIRAIQSALWGDMGGALREGIGRAAEFAAAGDDVMLNYLQRHLGNEQLVKDLREGFVARAKRGLDAILAKAKNNIPLSTQVYRTQALATGLVHRRVNAGLLLGYSAKRIAGMVRDLISPKVAGGVSYAAFRLARTEINNAYKTAQEARYADEPWSKGMQWHLSASHPREDICDVYATQDIHGMGAGVYPFGELPNAHPQDMCYNTPVQAEEDEFIEGFLAGEYDDYLDKELGDSPERSQVSYQPKQPEMEPAPRPVLDPRPNVRAPEVKKQLPLTKEERSALRSYSTGLYSKINGLYRHNTPHGFLASVQSKKIAEFERTLEGMESAFNKASLAKPMTVYRGVTGDAIPKGVKFLTDKGYVSTSDERGVADNFSKAAKDGTLLEIHLPKGSRVLRVAGIEKGEAEWLIDRDSVFEIIEDRVINGRRVVKAKLLGKEASAGE